jgi:predicted ATPase/class 3 adenylate cyclase
MPQLPTGTVTFLFTDIEGSTQLLQRLGDAYARVLGEHQALLRVAFMEHGGVEVDTQGDAFFVAFPTAPAAVAAASHATRALAEHAWPEGGVVRVRMGLHTGAPQLVGDHYVGLDVHRAARIASAGHGGQILLSQTTRALSAATLPDGATLRDLGAHRLKDLQEPEPIFQLILPGLPADFPPLKTLDTHQHNLPLQPTALLDRVEPRAALTALLRSPDVRLVTLTGPGGIGKTRLAVAVAAEVVDAFPDGVWYVRLSRLVDPDLVIPTIAQTLGLKEAGSQPITEILRAHVAERRLLLVLDNFEQVVGAAGEVAGLLAASPGLTALVTSRTPLRLRGEREYTLGLLPLPPLSEPGPQSPERLAQYAAVTLFVERAQAAQPDFAVTGANAPAIAEICARLDGLPLAIELAGARVKLLPPEALLARLSTTLKLLIGGARDLEERQQTMRATLAWSDDLLQPEEQRLFYRLAVFVGGCTLEAAEAICAAPAGAAPLELDLLDGLSALVDHSLVQQREEDGEPRFGMLHIMREYARERLEASEGGKEAEALRRAHADYFLALAERALPELSGPEGVAWLGRLEREHDNLRAALGWARERGAAETGLRLVSALWRFWWGRGYLREGRAWVDEMLALGDGSQPPTAAPMAPDRVRVQALRAGGILASWQGDVAAAEPRLEAAAALARASGDLQTAARALNDLGNLASRQSDLKQAAARYQECLMLSREVGDQASIATALGNLGDIAARQGDLERAAAFSEEALMLFRPMGYPASVAVLLLNLSWVARQRGEYARAEALGREGLALAREVGDPRQCAEQLERLASTAGVTGEGARAARLLGAAIAVRETLGAPQPPDERVDVEQAVAAARVALGEERWEAAIAAGRALSLEQAIAEALDGDGEGGNG